MPTLESPCNKVCTIEPMSGLCLGCGRSLVEIERWLAFTPAERAEVMAHLPQRLARLRRPDGAIEPG